MNGQILLIDDEAEYRQTIKLLFAKEPYQFLEAETPALGIVKLKNNPQVHVILLDLSFASGKAKEVLDYLKPRSSDYRVIVLTGHDELLDAEQADQYEVIFTYLPKAERSSTQAIRFAVEQAFKDLERKDLARKVDFLLEVQEKANTNQNTNETLNKICEFLRTITGAYTCHIRVYDRNHGDYRLRGFAGDDHRVRSIFERPRPKGEIFSGTVVETGEPKIFENLQNDEGFKRFKMAALQESKNQNEKETYWTKVQSAYIVPISTGVMGEFVEGVLNLSSDSIDFFDQDKCALVDQYKALVTLTIAKEWLNHKSGELHRDYSEISETLSRITWLLPSPDADKKIYEVVTHKIARLIGAEVVTIFLYNETTSMVESVAELRGRTFLQSPVEAYHPGKSFTGWIYKHKETIYISNDPTSDARFDLANLDDYLKDVPSGRIEHYLGVPIRVGDKILGVLRAINKMSKYYTDFGPANPHCLLERGFSLDCRNAMEITASHLAVVISNLELLREKDRQLEQITLLSEVGALINSAREIDEVLNLTIQKMADVMGAEICMLFLAEGDDRITLRQCFGMSPISGGAWYELGEGVTGRVASTGKAELVEQAWQEGKYDDFIRLALSKQGSHPHIESLMVVPIVAKGKLLGAMKVINKKGERHKFTDRDLKQFQMLANYVSVALENAQVYKVANDRLAVAERNAALSSLVMAVGHEINNTSGLIPANVAGIKNLIGNSDPDVNIMLSSIEDAATQATEFANEIAGFSATWRGTKEVLDILPVIRQAIDSARSKNPTEIPVEITDDSKSLLCELYRTPFIQIIRNIIVNAFQALENTSSAIVRVSTCEIKEGAGNSFAVIEILDNGPGIRPQHLRRIFDADFTTKPKGNGIGLWLARTQLELFGGEIRAESSPGYGTKFIIRIPISHRAGGSIL